MEIRIKKNSDSTFTVSLWSDNVAIKSSENISFSELPTILNNYRKLLN